MFASLVAMSSCDFCFWADQLRVLEWYTVCLDKTEQVEKASHYSWLIVVLLFVLIHGLVAFCLLNTGVPPVYCAAPLGCPHAANGWVQ